MKDLEKLLSKTLPDMVERKPEKISGKEIHTLTEGEYLDPEKMVFLKKYQLQLNSRKDYDLSKYKISEIIIKYAAIPETELEDLLFIDTETTGLAGGTGTYAFLIGLGYFQGDVLQIEQIFLTDIAGEEVLLKILTEYLQRFKVLVSYNGKSYDIPLLKNRYIFHRQDDVLTEKGNIDLLHLSRRIWRNSLIDCSLKTIEKEILDVIRDDTTDIPGSEIPYAYFYYLDTKDASEMVRVIYHNYYDILSMVILLQKLSAITIEFSSLEFLEEIFGLAKLYHDQNDPVRAEELFLKILKIHPNHRESCKRLASIYKKNRNWGEAEKLWLKAVEQNEIYACEELAKYYEHTLKEVTSALNYTQKALQILYAANYDNDTLWQALDRRLKRLQTKTESEEKT